MTSRLAVIALTLGFNDFRSEAARSWDDNEDLFQEKEGTVGHRQNLCTWFNERSNKFVGHRHWFNERSNKFLVPQDSEEPVMMQVFCKKVRGWCMKIRCTYYDFYAKLEDKPPQKFGWKSNALHYCVSKVDEFGRKYGQDAAVRHFGPYDDLPDGFDGFDFEIRLGTDILGAGGEDGFPTFQYFEAPVVLRGVWDVNFGLARRLSLTSSKENSRQVESYYFTEIQGDTVEVFDRQGLNKQALRFEDGEVAQLEDQYESNCLPHFSGPYRNQ